MASVIDVVLNLVDRVTNPLRTVQREMERTANMNRRLGRDIERIGSGFSSVGESMLPIAAGITAIGVAGGRAFIDFDSIITGAAAKAGATADEMEMMRQKASQFGADFPISATQAAEGMDRLAAAGYDANQVIGVMPSVITAAVASGEDLATTSDVVSNALNIWNLKQGDIEQNAMRVADVVQMAANKSSLGMADFGLAMQYAGAPAATLNVSIEQLATAMAIMKNNGIEASTIGTSLRSVFSRLSEPPKPAAEAIEALGLQVKDATGNFLGLQPIVEQLRGKILNLSNTEQVAYAKALAGEEAYSGLLALVKTAPEDYQALQDAMDSATGSSQAQFEVMKGTLKNSIDGMLGSLESLAINFGTVLTPQIKMITDSIGNFADIKEKGYDALWSVNDTSVFKASVKLDGIDFVDFSDLTDGYHTMTISVTDEVGHVTTETFDFTYDGTAPRIIITGVDDKSVVRNPFTMKIGLEDADDMLTEIVINGDTIDPALYEDTNSYEFQVENYGNYKVRVSARDTAGNVTSTYDSATDEVFSFQLKEKTSPILIVIIILAILAVVAVILLLIMKKRRNSHSSK